MGLGEDGHTASLFPQNGSLDVQDRWVVASPPGSLPPPVERVTMTYPILNLARNIFFVVSGAKKAPALKLALNPSTDFHQIPAAGIRPIDGKVIWFTDRSAAEDLQQ
jgi:6-phosphogluconolactonase